MKIKDILKKIPFKDVFSIVSLIPKIYKQVKGIKDEKAKQDFLKALRDGDIDKLNRDLLE